MPYVKTTLYNKIKWELTWSHSKATVRHTRYNHCSDETRISLSLSPPPASKDICCHQYILLLMLSEVCASRQDNVSNATAK